MHVARPTDSPILTWSRSVPASLARQRAVDGLLVSERWLTEDAARACLNNPSSAGQHVPGWRAARVLHDPHGIAAAIKRDAAAWSWDDLGDAPDRTVVSHL